MASDNPASQDLWIFGYGSLIWRPAFKFVRSAPGYIQGYRRRFWQGSVDHRGVPGKPGRVVTLIEDAHPHGEHFCHCPTTSESKSESAPVICQPSRTYGVVFQVAAADREEVLSYLDFRESYGYCQAEVDVHLCSPPCCSDKPIAGHTVRALVYMATPDCEGYLGPETLANVAAQISTAKGPSGLNTEYLFNLAQSLNAIYAANRARREQQQQDPSSPAPDLLQCSEEFHQHDIGEDHFHISELDREVRKLVSAACSSASAKESAQSSSPRIDSVTSSSKSG